MLAVVAMTACSGGMTGGGGSALPDANPAAASPETPQDVAASPQTDADATAQSATESPAAQLVSGVADGDIPFMNSNPVRRICPQPTRPNEMECDALVRTDLPAMQPDGTPYGYSAHDLQAAYKLPISRGKGHVVAIIDAYGYPHASSDLAVYRKQYHLPPCNLTNGCLRILDERGGHNLPPPNNLGWDYEQAIDLDMVSAACPNCKLILFQASSDQISDLYQANYTAAKLGVDVTSNSYSGVETAAQYNEFFPAGHTYVGSAGDYGGGTLPSKYAGPQQPCDFSDFICAGGTHLVKSTNARGWNETVWNDQTYDQCGAKYTSPCGATGSGCSKLVAKPSWQHDSGCRMRTETDIGASASVRAPVAVFHTPGNWLAYGGTSVSAPLIAGMIGLAGNGKSTIVAERIWNSGGSASINNVVSGTNVYKPVTGPCSSAIGYICIARKGYSGPTGWGSPSGVGAL
ncbi:MAG TPA: hypothetical protein VMF61_10885 [Candidatus Acidoferrales bacterium]|nr:hypothetical protein [Candidatus Acidoferrales bacterium]